MRWVRRSAPSGLTFPSSAFSTPGRSRWAAPAPSPSQAARPGPASSLLRTRCRRTTRAGSSLTCEMPATNLRLAPSGRDHLLLDADAGRDRALVLEGDGRGVLERD